MSTTPNEAPVPEASQDYPHQPLNATGSVPPVPPAPPYYRPSDGYGYGQQSTEGYEQPQPQSAPAYGPAPTAQYPQSPYQGLVQQYHPQTPGYQGYPAQGYPNALNPGAQAASTSMTMGIIATVMTVLIGWVPLFGLLGVACGVGLGIPALLSAKKAEQQGYSAVAGKALGWVAIGISALWVAAYIIVMILGAMFDPNVSSV